jgi:hypothetical protein
MQAGPSTALHSQAGVACSGIRLTVVGVGMFIDGILQPGRDALETAYGAHKSSV